MLNKVGEGREGDPSNKAAIPRTGGRRSLGAIPVIVILEEKASFLYNCVSESEDAACLPTHRAILAERAGLAMWRRVAAKQIITAEGFICQQVVRKVLLGTSEVAWLWSRRRIAGLGLGWRWTPRCRWAAPGWGWTVRRPNRGCWRGHIRIVALALPFGVGVRSPSTCDTLLSCVLRAIPLAHKRSASLNSGMSQVQRCGGEMWLTQSYVHEFTGCPT